MPAQPVKISRQHNDNRSLIQDVMEEEPRHGEGDNATSNLKSSVYDKL